MGFCTDTTNSIDDTHLEEALIIDHCLYGQDGTGCYYKLNGWTIIQASSALNKWVCQVLYLWQMWLIPLCESYHFLKHRVGCTTFSRTESNFLNFARKILVSVEFLHWPIFGRCMLLLCERQASLTEIIQGNAMSADCIPFWWKLIYVQQICKKRKDICCVP